MTDNTFTQTHWIAEPNQKDFETKMSKAVRKADKVGQVIAWAYTGNTETRTQKDAKGRKNYYNALEVKVMGIAPQINGWVFVGAIEHLETGNLVKQVPNQDFPDGRNYRNANADCQHCGQNRKRKNTYIVRNETGTYKQVGSSCLIDFLGHKSPHAIAEYAGWLALLDFGGFDNVDPDYWGQAGSSLLDTVSVLRLASSVIRSFGFCSSRMARENHRVPTWEIANNAYWETDPRKANFISIDGRDIETAEKVMNWVMAQDDTETNDYMHNLIVACSQQALQRRHVALVVSAVYSYQKALDKKEAEANKPISEFVGEIKKRQDFEMTWVKTHSFETDWGMTHINIFNDKDGNVIVWKTGTFNGANEEKTNWTGKATVKAHEVYNRNGHDTKQTIITRAKLTSK